jgi:hypothetical protein
MGITCCAMAKAGKHKKASSMFFGIQSGFSYKSFCSSVILKNDAVTNLWNSFHIKNAAFSKNIDSVQAGIDWALTKPDWPGAKSNLP